MQVETEVVHTVVAVGETEVDVTSTERYVFRLIDLMAIGTGNGRVIEGFTAAALQHTALQPYLISTREHGDIV